jgi:hypothetical protein
MLKSWSCVQIASPRYYHHDDGALTMSRLSLSNFCSQHSSAQIHHIRSAPIMKCRIIVTETMLYQSMRCTTLVPLSSKLRAQPCYTAPYLSCVSLSLSFSLSISYHLIFFFGCTEPIRMPELGTGALTLQPRSS